MRWPCWRWALAAVPSRPAAARLRNGPTVLVAALQLKRCAAAAADRIAGTTGLAVRTTAEPAAGGLPLAWEQRGADEVWVGSHAPPSADRHRRRRRAEALLGTVVLHEIRHALGVEPHVDSGAGVLSPKVWAPFSVTAADLDAVCSVRACATFIPKGCDVALPRGARRVGLSIGRTRDSHQ